MKKYVSYMIIRMIILLCCSIGIFDGCSGDEILRANIEVGIDKDVLARIHSGQEIPLRVTVNRDKSELGTPKWKAQFSMPDGSMKTVTQSILNTEDGYNVIFQAFDVCNYYIGVSVETKDGDESDTDSITIQVI